MKCVSPTHFGLWLTNLASTSYCNSYESFLETNSFTEAPSITSLRSFCTIQVTFIVIV